MHATPSSARCMLAGFHGAVGSSTTIFNEHNAYLSLDINERDSREKHNELMCRRVEISDRHSCRLLCDYSLISSCRDTRGNTESEYSRADTPAQDMCTLEQRNILRQRVE